MSLTRLVTSSKFDVPPHPDMVKAEQQRTGNLKPPMASEQYSIEFDGEAYTLCNAKADPIFRMPTPKAKLGSALIAEIAKAKLVSHSPRALLTKAIHHCKAARQFYVTNVANKWRQLKAAHGNLWKVAATADLESAHILLAKEPDTALLAEIEADADKPRVPFKF